MFASAPGRRGMVATNTFTVNGMMVHITAPKIDPGYQGKITLEMFNLGPFPLKLSYGMDICALMFEQLILPADAGYAGRFQG